MILALVANPRSGGGTDPDTLSELLARNGARVIPVRLDELDAPLPAGTDRVVLAGGDGSVGVAARAAHRAGLPLAVIAAGTANDLARAAGLTTYPRRAGWRPTRPRVPAATRSGTWTATRS